MKVHSWSKPHTFRSTLHMLSADHFNIDGLPFPVKCVRKFRSALGGEVAYKCAYACACMCVQSRVQEFGVLCTPKNLGPQDSPNLANKTPTGYTDIFRSECVYRVFGGVVVDYMYIVPLDCAKSVKIRT